MCFLLPFVPIAVGFLAIAKPIRKHDSSDNGIDSGDVVHICKKKKC
jgi:hypothetical protein